MAADTNYKCNLALHMGISRGSFLSHIRSHGFTIICIEAKRESVDGDLNTDKWLPRVRIVGDLGGSTDVMDGYAGNLRVK